MKTKTKTRKIPATRQFREVSLMIETKEKEEAYTELINTDGLPVINFDFSASDPLAELERIINSGSYEIKIVRGYLTIDKPLVIIKEL